MIWTKLQSHIMPLQQRTRFYIPTESTFRLFVAYYHEFRNKESYDGFVLPVKREL